MDLKIKPKDMITYFLIGLFILYILYSKGMILADFHFLTSQEAAQTIKNEENNVTILDVRTLEEYKSLGHIKNAVLVPLQELENNIDALKKFKDKKILVYCASGNRSIAASRILEKNGFNTYNMNGGIQSWQNKGYEISK
ncbi:rhodanese-like domain-containing protein [Sulfurimonas sp.]|nr:rhodanese-like domain-containing protein [Sulfurimonas sp.]